MNLNQHITKTDQPNKAQAPGPFFQAKLSINQPGDRYEQEADAMADRVMLMPDSPAQHSFFSPAINNINRKCQHCEEEEKLHRKERSANEVQGGNQLDSYVNSLGSSGQPLPESSRKFFEPRFGQDFSGVRVHTDTVASKSAQSINALAYTTGNNIVFNSGQYVPDSDSGKRLMAHELTHVVQQGNGTNSQKLQRLSGIETFITPEQIAEMRNLFHEFEALEEGELLTAAEIAEVGEAVEAANSALVVATEVVEAGTTAVTIGEGALVTTGVLAADDVTVIGVADDVAIPFILVGAAIAFGVGYAIGSSASEIAAAGKKAANAVKKAVDAIQRAVKRVKAKTQPAPQPAPKPQPNTTKTKKKQDPSDERLPISWPAELPLPTSSPRDLRRVTAADREWEGIERGAEQRRFSDELRMRRDRLMPLPPGIACFEDESDPNTPFDSHHIHPMYLNGEDSTWNLCALETMRHLRGHARLDNQLEFLPIYIEHGVFSPLLRNHSPGQEYEIVSEK